MDDISPETRRLTNAMINSAGVETSLADLLTVVASPSGSLALVTSVVDQLRQKSGSIEGGLDAAMELLESLYDSLGDSSLFLIAALWSIAAQVNGMHDACDAIDLWIVNNMTPRLRSYLTALAVEQSDEVVKAHYTQLSRL